MSRYLLDTCTFLWLVAGDETLSSKAAEIIRNPDHEIFLSVISVWEISIKHGANKLPLPQRPDVFVRSQLKIICWSVYRCLKHMC